VSALAAQIAADGYDLDADWRELDRATSTTGRCVAHIAAECAF